MCGIGGVIMYPKDRYAWELEYIRNLTKHLAIENQSRGRDATGVVAFNNDGTKLFKAPQNAMRFVNTATYGRFANEAIGHDTHSILIHTRAGTKGPESNNDNNHPIESHKFIGVHNGMIYNDDELFESERLFRLAMVDSEVIFRLHDKYGDDSLESIKQAAEKLAGGFTYSFASKTNRNILYLVRNNNPVTMVYIPKLNIISFASEKRFLHAALAEANELFGYDEFITEDDCVFLEPSARTIMTFDASDDTPMEQICQDGLSFSPSYASYYGGGYEDWVYDEVYGWKLAYDGYGGYKRKKAEIEEEGGGVESTIQEIFNSLDIESRLLLESFIDAEKDMAWNTGWSDGRSSLDDEIRYSKGLAYESGYDKGFKEGQDEMKIEVQLLKEKNSV